MTTPTGESTRSYTGLARVLDDNGLLIDVGKGDFEVDDEDTDSWSGTIAVYRGSSLDSKLVTGLVELSDGRRGRATVGPKVATLQEDLVAVKVRGIDGTVPF